jgi:hypothetical protein
MVAATGMRPPQRALVCQAGLAPAGPSGASVCSAKIGRPHGSNMEECGGTLLRSLGRIVFRDGFAVRGH